MRHLSENLKNSIERKLRDLNNLRPLPPSAVRKLKEQFEIEMTYNSNGIEGNSLTLKETFLVINEGITVKGKPLKDHLEAKNHYEALEFLSDLVERGKRHTASEVLIRNLHKLIMLETDKNWAGKYRNSDVFIAGSSHKPPSAIEVPILVRNLVYWLNQNRKKLHPVELAAIFHHKLVYIHPFFDGNGRTARLVMNLLLMQVGYPLVVILKNDRKKYYQVLNRADKKDYTPFVRFIAQAVERSLDIYLKTLTPASQIKEKYLSLSKISKQVPYSAKYLNLLIRQGKLEGHKEGRIWLTTKEAVGRYIKNRKRKR